MKKIIRKTITLLLTLLVMLEVVGINTNKIYAIEQDKPFKLECILWYNKTLRDVEYVIHNDELYVRAKDVPYLADATCKDIVGGDTRFVRNDTSLYCDGARYFDGKEEYYNLKEVMDALNVKYLYLDYNGIQTIIYQPYMTRYELDTICSQYLKGIYSLHDLGSNPLMYAGALWDIISGVKINAIWGGYSREVYEKLFCDIICSQPSEDSIFSHLNNANKTIKKINEVYKGTLEVDLGRSNNLAAVLGIEGNSILEYYGELKEKNKVFSLGDGLDIAERLWKIQSKTDIYVNAVRLGIADNHTLGFFDGTLKDTAIVAVDYYNENCDEKSIISAMIEDTVAASVSNVSADRIKEILFTAGMKKVSALLKMEKVFFDLIGGKEAYSATNAYVYGSKIQDAAIAQYDYCKKLPDNFFTKDDALRMKYSTILCLRTCQLAYEKLKAAMEFGDDAIKECAEAIAVLTEIDDRYIYTVVDNDDLSSYFVSGKVVAKPKQSNATYCLKKIEGSKNQVVDQELLGPLNKKGTNEKPIYIAVQDVNRGTTLATVAYYNDESEYYNVVLEEQTKNKFFFTLDAFNNPQLFVYDSGVERLDTVDQGRGIIIINDNIAVLSRSYFSNTGLYSTETTDLYVDVCDDSNEYRLWDNRCVVSGKSLLYYFATDEDVYYGYVNEPAEASYDYRDIYWTDEYNDMSNIRYEVYKYNIKTNKSKKLGDCSIYDLLDFEESTYKGVFDGKDYRMIEAEIEYNSYYKTSSIMDYIKSFVGNKSIKMPTERDTTVFQLK